MDNAQELLGSENQSNGGEVDQIGQREVNNSGPSGEEQAHLDEKQNKESSRNFINNEAKDTVVENFAGSNVNFEIRGS